MVFLRSVVLSLLVLVALPAHALLLAPEDPGVRHDLRLVADAGLLPGTLSTWPVSRAALRDGLSGISDSALESAAPWERAAVARLRSHFGLADGAHGRLRVEGVAGKGTPPARLGWFGVADPSGSDAVLDTAWTGGDRASVQLSVRAVEDPVDDDHLRLDGTHGAVRGGNWIVAAGSVPVWWGPAWSGSPIMGTAARPVPGVHLVRAQPRAFESRWLDWIGPWTLHAFYGRLESDRHSPHADLMGMRVAFQPTDRLEVGLSRSAIWGGERFGQSGSQFWQVVIGDTNHGDAPADQMAGWDVRYRFPADWALYGHFIGEDEAGMLPANYFGTFGMERWGGNRDGVASRWFAEYANTATRFYENRRTFNQAYEHSRFRTGNRYRGRPLGYPTDNDANILTLGWLRLEQDRENSLILRLGQLNRDDANRGGEDGPGRNSITERRVDMVDAEYLHRRPMAGGTWTIGGGAAWLDEAGADAEFEPRLVFGFERRF